MTRRVGPGRPPTGTRFRKGESGNPKGRPKRRRERPASAFENVFDRTVTVTQDGTPREITVEEALQFRTYQHALAGNRAARREVLKMIAKREKWQAARIPRFRVPEQRIEGDPLNAHAALLIL